MHELIYLHLAQKPGDLKSQRRRREREGAAGEFILPHSALLSKESILLDPNKTIRSEALWESMLLLLNSDTVSGNRAERTVIYMLLC
jgi:hypothetical protein